MIGRLLIVIIDTDTDVRHHWLAGCKASAFDGEFFAEWRGESLADCFVKHLELQAGNPRSNGVSFVHSPFP